MSDLNRYLRAAMPALLLAMPVGIALPSDARTARDEKLFARYPVTEIYKSPVQLPDFGHRDRAFSMFRTRIREGMHQGANLAGHYALVGWGCGTECLIFVVGDVASGEVFKFPFGGDDNQEPRLDSKAGSRAIIARCIRYTDKSSKDAVMIVNCLRQDFVWNGSSAVALLKPVVVGSVKETDTDVCADK